MALGDTACIYPPYLNALMETRLCYQVLELQPGISQTELRQAYKDLVQVWHPDRFSHNPRLQAKAQVKMTEINDAYGTLKPILEQRDRLNDQLGGASHGSGQRNGKSSQSSSSSATGKTAASAQTASASQHWTSSHQNQTDWGQSPQFQRRSYAGVQRSGRFSLRWYFTVLGMTLAVMVCLLAPFLIAFVVAQQPGLFLLPVVAVVSLYSYRYLGIRS